MIFEALQESLERGELLLLEGALCRYHLRRDGQITIQEILVTPSHRRQKKASQIVSMLSKKAGAKQIVARCPVDLESNFFWAALGFQAQSIETTKSGRKINVWVLLLLSIATEATNAPKPSPES